MISTNNTSHWVLLKSLTVILRTLDLHIGATRVSTFNRKRIIETLFLYPECMFPKWFNPNQSLSRIVDFLNPKWSEVSYLYQVPLVRALGYTLWEWLWVGVMVIGNQRSWDYDNRNWCIRDKDMDPTIEQVRSNETFKAIESRKPTAQTIFSIYLFQWFFFDIIYPTSTKSL